jgi:NHL repeat
MVAIRISKYRKLTYGMTAVLCTLTVYAEIPSAQAAAAEVTTYAGSGAKGELDGPAATAQFYFPSDVGLDNAGNLYVVSNQNIRKIAADGTVSTLAGASKPGFADGVGTAAMFYQPTDLDVDSAGNVYVADPGNKRVRKITPAGVVTTLAGSGQAGSIDGPGATATFNAPYAVAVDAAGTVYVADYQNKIRKISSDGIVSTVAGSGERGYLDGPAATATFAGLTGIAVDSTGSIFVSDSENRRVRKISGGIVSTFAGSGNSARTNGKGTAASFVFVNHLTIDSSDTLYLTDLNAVLSISPAGIVKTIAGSPTGAFGAANGPAPLATFSSPSSPVIDGFGSIFLADSGNNVIRKITGTPNIIARAVKLPGGIIAKFSTTTTTIKFTTITIKKRF